MRYASASSSLGRGMGPAATGASIPVPREIPPDRIVLRHMRTPAEIDLVRPLRGHINLAAHGRVDPLFELHEKKETSWA